MSAAVASCGGPELTNVGPDGSAVTVPLDRSGQANQSRRAAASLVWNPAPGDPRLPRLAYSPPLPPSFSSTDVDAAPSAVPLQFVAGATPRALVLYDATGPYAFLGELYAIGAANLASHFGAWTARPAASYVCGEVTSYDAVIYLGSTYDEALPTCLLDDVAATTRPVYWSFYNLWQLSNRMGAASFSQRYGFQWTALDFGRIAQVRYKGRTLTRYADNGAGLLGTSVTDATRATVLAEAVHDDGTTVPWAIRGGNLTYIAEIPFSYMSEEDRWLVFADLLFDALAVPTAERHRALVRLEDIDPLSDTTELRAVADYLYSQGVPFGFSVVPRHVDNTGYYNDGVPLQVALTSNSTITATLRYLQTRGGVMVMHGRTHQWAGGINPYTGVTGDDTEFYRVTENADHTLTYVGALPGDSLNWARDRLSNAFNDFTKAGLARPTIFEFPHYAASPNAYRAAATTVTTRWERALYFGGQLRGTPTTRYVFGQLFPYAVRDVYGTRVLPEDLGSIEPTAFYIYPPRLPADILRAATSNLVVRDGVAGFYFHPFFDLAYLRTTVEGMRALGYTFVSPTSITTP